MRPWVIKLSPPDCLNLEQFRATAAFRIPNEGTCPSRKREEPQPKRDLARNYVTIKAVETVSYAKNPACPFQRRRPAALRAAAAGCTTSFGECFHRTNGRSDV